MGTIHLKNNVHQPNNRHYILIESKQRNKNHKNKDTKDTCAQEQKKAEKEKTEVRKKIYHVRKIIQLVKHFLRNYYHYVN